MTRPPITPGTWLHESRSVFALTPYIGKSPHMKRMCPDGINRFSCHVNADNPVLAGGAEESELEANARAIAALPDLLAALETLAHGLNHDESSNDYQIIKQALTKAGYTF